LEYQQSYEQHAACRVEALGYHAAVSMTLVAENEAQPKHHKHKGQDVERPVDLLLLGAPAIAHDLFGCVGES
jgi:hypothetical protein